MRFKSRIIIKIALGLVALWVVGCDSSKPPPAPPEAQKAKRAEESGDSVKEDDSVDDSLGEATKTTAKSSFVRVAAKVGDSDTQDEVKKCNDAEKFFDRFNGDAGTCVEIALAKVDCTMDGIRKVLTARQRDQLDDAMAGSYKDWTLDQCVNCKKDTDSKLCETSSGDHQVGTKLFFVKDEDGEIRGKSMLVPYKSGD